MPTLNIKDPEVYGDCLVYALAKVTGETLLFKGDDFTHTDVTPAR